MVEGVFIYFIYLLYFARTSYNKLQRLMDNEKNKNKKQKKTGRVTTTVRTNYRGPYCNILVDRRPYASVPKILGMLAVSPLSQYLFFFDVLPVVILNITVVYSI